MRTVLICAALTCSLAGAQPTSSRTITLTHDEGTTRVPFNPKRVVVLDLEMLGWLYALGLGDRVVGVGNIPVDALGDGGMVQPARQKSGFLARGDVSGARSVGSSGTPNLEVITLLKPDVILRLTWQGNQNYDKLSRIAPTVGYREASVGFWQAGFRDVARMFGRQERAEQVIRQVAQNNRANARALLAAGVFRKFPKAIVLAPYNYDGGENRVFTRVRVADDLRALGFKDGLPGIRSDDGLAIGAAVSDEALLKLDPKTLVVIVPPTLVAGSTDKLLASPVGKRLAAQSVLYLREELSPWTGPLVSLNNSSAMTRAILEKWK